MWTQRSVSARRSITDIAIIEFAASEPMKNVTLVKDYRPAIRQESASLSFDCEDGPYLGAVYTEHFTR